MIRDPATLPWFLQVVFTIGLVMVATGVAEALQFVRERRFQDVTGELPDCEAVETAFTFHEERI